MAWSDFCRHALLKNENRITIVDEGKFHWKCTMQFVEQDNRLVCKIGGDWKAICVRRNFRVGHAIKLGVCGDRGSHIVFLAHVPLACIHTNYVRPPKVNLTENYVYQINHFFLSCPLKMHET